MIKSFAIWLDSLAWAPALAFMCAVAVFLCMLILLVDGWLHSYELRAIAKRDAEEERQRAEAEQQEETWRFLSGLGRLDQSEVAGPVAQLSIPRSMRDMKGVTLQ